MVIHPRAPSTDDQFYRYRHARDCLSCDMSCVICRAWAHDKGLRELALPRPVRSVSQPSC